MRKQFVYAHFFLILLILKIRHWSTNIINCSYVSYLLCSFAFLISPTNKGAGLSGLDLNSG